MTTKTLVMKDDIMFKAFFSKIGNEKFLKDLMAEKENELIKEAKENYNVLTGDEEVKRLAEIRLMSQLEEQAALSTARDKGLEQGMKEGLEQGKKRRS